MKITAIVLSAAALALTACSPAGDADTDIHSVEALMMEQFDRPDAPLDAGPVAVSGDVAVADWTQGDMGGRALLRRRDGEWRLVLCGGEQLRTAEGLMAIGVDDDDARRLADRLAVAEADLAPERAAAIAAFEGLVRMDGQDGQETGEDRHDDHRDH